MGGLAIPKSQPSKKGRAMVATIGHNKELHTAMAIKEGDIIVYRCILSLV